MHCIGTGNGDRLFLKMGGGGGGGEGSRGFLNKKPGKQIAKSQAKQNA